MLALTLNKNNVIVIKSALTGEEVEVHLGNCPLSSVRLAFKDPDHYYVITRKMKNDNRRDEGRQVQD